MTTRGRTRVSGWRRRAVATAASLAVVGGALSAPALTTSALADDAPELPDVIPSLTDWTAGDGAFSLEAGARIVAEGEAAERGALLVEELSAILGDDVEIVSAEADAGDIALSIDATRSPELGAEGYELTIGESIEIEAADSQGVFYGTRTLAQMFGQQLDLPAGSTVDVPEFEERGVTLCACQINVSTDWIDRLLEEMSYLKLNYLLLELKVKIDTPEYAETATWSYYTPEDIRELDAKAQELGIEVIPEINSPGHMGIWLENLPELQLRDREGNPDEFRLDITTPEAFEFYTDLIDEYFEAFSSDYWHMGADEYMIDTDFDNYPQVGEYATRTWGEDATPWDAYVDYINQINDYVKEQGKTLRIWNDGLTGANNEVPLDTDIVVEHWKNSHDTPEVLTGRGHRVMNSAYELYIVRGGFKMNTAQLYNSGWTIGQFRGGATLPLDNPNLTGAKISLWPDTGSAQTENQVEEEMFMPLRFISQMTWSVERAFPSYGEFQSVAQEIGRPLFWENVERQPVEGGTYTITSTDGGILESDGSVLATSESGTETWALTPTDDGYYRIASTGSDRCLDVVDGPQRLQVPVGIGVDVVAQECASSNIQKWQVIDDGDAGFEIVNASTQQHLAIDDDGAVVQLPHDVTDSRWVLSAPLTVGSVTADAGSSVDVPVTVTNATDEDYTNGVVSVEVPEGWADVPAVTFETLAAGASADLMLAVAVPEDAVPGDYLVPVTVVTDQGRFTALFTLTVEGERPTLPAEPELIAQELVSIEDVSSEQTEQYPGLAEYTLDGSTQTMWHNEWAVTEGPHHISFDLGDEYWVESLIYTPRQTDSRNGVLKDYEVYVSHDPQEWGEPVATGSLEDTWDDSVLDLGDAVGRYVRLVYLDSYNDSEAATNATAAEINFTGVRYTEEPTEEPTGEPTEEPTGEPTEEPTPEEPTEEEPTEEPTTEEPTTEEPTTEEPTTEEPTTEEPTTEEPTTEEPTTEEPTVPGDGELVLGDVQVRAGENLAVAGAGFVPGETVVFTVGDLELGTAVADADGVVSADLSVPADLEPGSYELTASGAEQVLTVEFEVLAASVEPPTTPGTDPTTDGGEQPTDGVPGDGVPGDGGDDLPSTGASIGAATLVVLGLLAAGAVLVARRRTAAQG